MVEFKLGLRGASGLPPPDGNAWCRLIDAIVGSEEHLPNERIVSARFSCDGGPIEDVVARFIPTDPPTLIAQRGDRVMLMTLRPSASGARYEGPDGSFWEHQGEARISWGRGAVTERCSRVDGSVAASGQ